MSIIKYKKNWRLNNDLIEYALSYAVLCFTIFFKKTLNKHAAIFLFSIAITLLFYNAFCYIKNFNFVKERTFTKIAEFLIPRYDKLLTDYLSEQIKSEEYLASDKYKNAKALCTSEEETPLEKFLKGNCKSSQHCIKMQDISLYLKAQLKQSKTKSLASMVSNSSYWIKCNNFALSCAKILMICTGLIFLNGFVKFITINSNIDKFFLLITPLSVLCASIFAMVYYSHIKHSTNILKIYIAKLCILGEFIKEHQMKIIMKDMYGEGTTSETRDDLDDTIAAAFKIMSFFEESGLESITKILNEIADDSKKIINDKNQIDTNKETAEMLINDVKELFAEKDRIFEISDNIHNHEMCFSIMA